MEVNLHMDRYKDMRYNFFKWQYELDIVYKISLALGFACLTGLVAQVKFFMPGLPVPITGQTFAVILAPIILGRWGGISQVMYVGIGFAGVPWFAGWTGGLSVLTGSSIGYIIGFVIASFFLGYFSEKYIRSRSFFNMLPLMLFANFVLIYIPGLIGLYLWWTSFIGSIGLVELLTIGIIPFILGDIVKIVAAAGVAKAVLPKTSYGREVDTEKMKKWHIS